MGTTYYVDPAGSNTSPYDTWAKAATAIQTAINTANTAGDIIYCRGTETTGATIDVDTNSGTNDGGWIKVIGCNASGNVDGTRYVIDANNGNFSVMTFNDASDMYWFENIQVQNTGVGAYHGFSGSGAAGDGHVFINCCATDCGGNGWNDFTSQAKCFRCCSYANTGHGFYRCSHIFFCCSRDNGDSGFEAGATVVIFGAISHGNTDDGIENLSPACSVLNSVIDGSGDDGVYVVANTNLYATLILGCRITNHSGSGDIGLNANSEPCIVGWTYFENNGGAGEENVQNDTLYQFIPLEGGSTTSNWNEGEDEDGTGTNQGYTNIGSGSEDFNLRSDASLRRTAITIPWS